MSHNVVDGLIPASSPTSTDAAITYKSLHVNGKLNCQKTQRNRTFNHRSTGKKELAFLRIEIYLERAKKFAKTNKSNNNHGINLK